MGGFFIQKMERVTSIYLHERGVLVDLPPQLAQNIFSDPDQGEFYMGEVEKQRLKAILKDPILKKRYPDYSDGDRYMDGVSPQWRDRLMGWSHEMTEAIKDACLDIGIDRFGVILHGSVAKNLAKQRTDADPSNIDLAVIGDISVDEGEEIKNIIRGARERITTRIRVAESCRCVGLRCVCASEVSLSKPSNPIERVGVLVQDIETLRKNDYYQARMFMSSCARVMYDPFDLWKALELEAVPSMAKFNMTRAERKRVMVEENRQTVPGVLIPVGSF
ncbi:MAG: hypothetical protein ACD_30C00003G0007 [uncultured bacterium]|uniref:Uncharacterized protein n=3 Tax=Candidatus Daviesiibacteriota TaxID=1752718 RepID=A0A0G0F1A3_9BACT|nr:MAG: hypothetical protein ACD_30C00003G0007 [uncultured bacterium]KKQ07440.1 MAG: hypothetical protein US19_C0046G0008 [Candidatus Daviesbacteria bacterium GW2011_GWB1_36_5]OGE16614.1 MAG: hypothetical protein A2858_02095 [Candidatus Daviesbacteria bacterium RIFCSPHIGHO2_01_FULL_36_37]OGE33669.1 MAG: hypothetical protein A3C99_02140 [Candidatus Daviesbacteria bacterium RIFCSPHIGHO2_02_FULL_37_9]OGE34697.1 MAG: hypothetical protein A3E66_03655 [Candidatus Daviesbacteria bacterium RIFCSPHIGHO2